MVAAKVDTEEDRLEVPVESKECMDSPTKGTACHRRRLTTTIPLRQQMQELLVRIIRLLVEIALPLEDSEITDALALHSRQKIHSSSLVLRLIITEACQMCSVAPSLVILARAPDSVRTWDSKVATRTLCAAMPILLRSPEAPVLPSASLEDDLVPLQLHKANQDCHHLRVIPKVSRATAGIWARCMAREARSMAVLQEAWVAITNMAVTVNKQEAMEVMGLYMVQAPTVTAIVEDGEVPITGTKIFIEWTRGLHVRCRSVMSLLISASSLPSQK